jgi:hypothetical protein
VLTGQQYAGALLVEVGEVDRPGAGDHSTPMGWFAPHSASPSRSG